MSIFEDKKHNDPKYVGQKPVTAVPEDIGRKGNVGNINEDNYPWSHGTRSVPNADSRVGGVKT